MIDGEAVLANEENLKGTDYYEAYQGLMATESGKEVWDKYASNDKKDIYIGLSEIVPNGRALNAPGLDAFSLGVGEDGKLGDLPYEGFEIFSVVDLSQSGDKEIALVSMNATDFSKKSENRKFLNSEGLFHEIKSHIDLDGGTGRDEHVRYGVPLGIGALNWGSSSVDANSPAGKFASELIESNVFNISEYLKNSILKALKN